MTFRKTAVAVVIAVCGNLIPLCLYVTASATAVSSSAVTDIAVKVVDGEVLLEWSSPSLNSDVISDYKVEYKKTIDSNWTTWVHTAPITGNSTTLTDLNDGSEYSFRVSPIIGSDVQANATSGIKNVAVGSTHTCIVKSDYTLWCLGGNSSGQLGHNDTTAVTSFQKVEIAPVRKVVAGRLHTCALLISGSVQCWGDNSSGQLGDGVGQQHTVPTDVSGLSSVLDISAGAMHTCAVLATHTVKCWGAGSNNRLGRSTSLVTNNSDSNSPSAVLNSDGTELGTVLSISAGTAQTCVVLEDNSVKCWGYNNVGQLGRPISGTGMMPDSVTGLTVSGISAVKQISVGHQHVCAVLTDGSLKCWGADAKGQVGNDATTQNAGVATPATVVDATGTALADIAAVAAGYESTCAVKINGTAFCWGNNIKGQLGDASTTQRNRAVLVNSASNFRYVAVDHSSNSTGLGRSCFVDAYSVMSCAGYNNIGQLGDETIVDKSVQTAVSQLGNFSIKVSGPLVAPTNVQVEAELNSALVSWTAANPHGLALTGYLAYVRESPEINCHADADATECRLTSIPGGTNYHFEVKTLFGDEVSTPASSSAVLIYKNPSAPLKLKAKAVGSLIKWSWSSSKVLGGQRFLKYEYQISKSKDHWPTKWSSAGKKNSVIKRAKSNTKYYFRVRILTIEGYSSKASRVISKRAN